MPAWWFWYSSCEACSNHIPGAPHDVQPYMPPNATPKASLLKQLQNSPKCSSFFFQWRQPTRFWVQTKRVSFDFFGHWPLGSWWDPGRKSQATELCTKSTLWWWDDSVWILKNLDSGNLAFLDLYWVKINHFTTISTISRLAIIFVPQFWRSPHHLCTKRLWHPPPQ